MKHSLTFGVISLIAVAVFSSFAIADSPIVRMARISAIDGQVSVRRAQDDQNAWSDATLNTPIGENDQLYAGQTGRAEIQLTGRNIVRLDGSTSFRISKFTTAVTQIAIPVGSAIFRIDSLDPRQFDVVDARDAGSNNPLYFEVNTPAVSITFTRTGVYRVTVQEDGTTEVLVRRGEAEVYNEDIRTMNINPGHRITIDGHDPGKYQQEGLPGTDNFDRWSDRRDEQLYIQSQSVSSRYVPQGIPGVYDLDRHGQWIYTPEYGWVWTPNVYSAGWAPYRAGYWSWYAGWGWTWVSTEPWGWAPYHYGRWSYYRDRWCWVPRGGLTVGFSWSPALVTFFGWGGGGYYGGGRFSYVGWLPLGYGEHYYNPWRGGVTVVNNYYNYSIDRYRNYNAPGAITRMDGGRFDSHRVMVTNNFSNVDYTNVRSASTLRGDTFRPSSRGIESARLNPQAETRANSFSQRQVVTRDGNTARSSAAFSNGARQNGYPTFRNNDVVRQPDRSFRPEGAQGGVNDRRVYDRSVNGANRDVGNMNRDINRNNSVNTNRDFNRNDAGNANRDFNRGNSGNTMDRRVDRPTNNNSPGRDYSPNNRDFNRGDAGNTNRDFNRGNTMERRIDRPNYNNEPGRDFNRGNSGIGNTSRQESAPRSMNVGPSGNNSSPAMRNEAPRQIQRSEAPRQAPRSESHGSSNQGNSGGSRSSGSPSGGSGRHR